MKEKILEIDNLIKKYSNKIVIKNLNLNIYKNEIISIIAPSGYGKTTLLNIISGIDNKYLGKIEKVNSITIGYMFQQPILLPWRNVLNNILIPVELKHSDKKKYVKKIFEYLKLFGLEGTHNLYPYQLSQGMYQRVALIQNIINEPELLLLDEPFSSLDYIQKLKLEIVLYKTLKMKNISAIIVTHDIEEAITLSDRILLFETTPLSKFKEYEVKIENRDNPAKIRNSKEFIKLFNLFWELIDTLKDK